MPNSLETELQIQNGINQATAAQDNKDPFWKQRALYAIKRVALESASVHRDQVRRVMDGDEPEHPNCWGGVWRRACKLGYIQATGRKVMSKDPRTRHPYEQYLSLIYKWI